MNCDILGCEKYYDAVNQFVNRLATAKRGSKALGNLRRIEAEQNEPNRCSLSARADSMLFEASQNMHQLRFVVVGQNMQLFPFYQQE